MGAKRNHDEIHGKGRRNKGGNFCVCFRLIFSRTAIRLFPGSGGFLKKGVSLTNVFLFIGAWSTTKIPMMLFEITQLGSKFTLVRFGLNLIAIIVLAIIMERTTTKEDSEAIYETASRQTDEK